MENNIYLKCHAILPLREFSRWFDRFLDTQPIRLTEDEHRMSGEILPDGKSDWSATDGGLEASIPLRFALRKRIGPVRPVVTGALQARTGHDLDVKDGAPHVTSRLLDYSWSEEPKAGWIGISLSVRNLANAAIRDAIPGVLAATDRTINDQLQSRWSELMRDTRQKMLEMFARFDFGRIEMSEEDIRFGLTEMVSESEKIVSVLEIRLPARFSLHLDPGKTLTFPPSSD